MKNKHRRLFVQNNRKAIHFYPISAKAGQSLRLLALLLISISNFMALNVSAAVDISKNEQLIKEHIQLKVSDFFDSIPAEDIITDIQFPAVVINKTCDNPLQFDWRSDLKPGQNTLKVACTAPRWQTYVPIKIQIFKNIVVSKSSLSRGHPIERNQLTIKRMNISNLRMGYFEKPNELLGYKVQRTVKSGQVITPYIVKAPSLIKRGDWVTIISGGNNIQVTSTGEALKDGVLGDQIPIRNLKTDKKIKAWILKKGVVSTRKL